MLSAKCETHLDFRTFPIGELDDLKHTTAFHKQSKRKWHQTLEHLHKCGHVRCSGHQEDTYDGHHDSGQGGHVAQVRDVPETWNETTLDKIQRINHYIFREKNYELHNWVNKYCLKVYRKIHFYQQWTDKFSIKRKFKGYKFHEEHKINFKKILPLGSSPSVLTWRDWGGVWLWEWWVWWLHHASPTHCLHPLWWDGWSPWLWCPPLWCCSLSKLEHETSNVL